MHVACRLLAESQLRRRDERPVSESLMALAVFASAAPDWKAQVRAQLHTDLVLQAVRRVLLAKSEMPEEVSSNR